MESIAAARAVPPVVIASNYRTNDAAVAGYVRAKVALREESTCCLFPAAAAFFCVFVLQRPCFGGCVMTLVGWEGVSILLALSALRGKTLLLATIAEDVRTAVGVHVGGNSVGVDVGASVPVGERLCRLFDVRWWVTRRRLPHGHFGLTDRILVVRCGDRSPVLAAWAESNARF